MQKQLVGQTVSNNLPSALNVRLFRIEARRFHQSRQSLYAQ